MPRPARPGGGSPMIAAMPGTTIDRPDSTVASASFVLPSFMAVPSRLVPPLAPLALKYSCNRGLLGKAPAWYRGRLRPANK
jgi:hypothetical protein